MKELAIGEIGEIDGVKVLCVASPLDPCLLCIFRSRSLDFCMQVPCTDCDRSDDTEVHFEEVKS